jgi:UDP-N-acetylglucosamine--N-acetylmuramyl-(pentapeptide) pyrophosphoryl-undecaprenol N-acetylglucosamine transferase
MTHSSAPWFVIAGGGTGGHLYPGLAVAEAMRAARPDLDVTVFGTPRPIDKQLVEPRGYELVPLEVMPFPGRVTAWPRFLLTWRRAMKAVRARFEQRRPAVVLGLGGYAAGPPIVAAAKLRIPTALFNPDAVPGRANRMLGPKVNRVFVQWSATRAHFAKCREVETTGCPVRAAFRRTSREEGVRALKLDEYKNTLLVTGASQGSASINDTMLELRELFRVAENWQIVHLTGTNDFERCRAAYREAGIDARLLSYTEHMHLCLAVADLVVSRAGASTLAEITAVGRASVLMPYPFDRHRHQNANAALLAEHHAAVIVEDANDAKDNARRLHEVLRDLLRSEPRRQRMAQAAAAMGRIDAAETIAERLLAMGRLSGGSSEASRDT